jgi:hypothetical protein
MRCRISSIIFTIKIILVICFFFQTTAVEAFPTFIMHGYPTCVSCHYNPSGGGALTPYGKLIAQELLGTFNDSETTLPWLTEPDPKAGFVASVLMRGAQTYFDTPLVKRSAFRKMQADLEVGYVTSDGWQAIAAFGPRLDAGSDGSGSSSTILTRRAWVGKVTQHHAIRAGKFFPEYGLYLPNHNIPTRKGLFFNHHQEPYVIQGTYFGSKQDFTFGLLEGSKGTELAKKRGYSTTWSYRENTYRFGVSRLDAVSIKEEVGEGAPEAANPPKAHYRPRSLSYGIFGQFSLIHELYLLFEADEKYSTNAKNYKQKTQVSHLETGFNIYKGIVPFFSVDYQREFYSDFQVRSPQLGLQILPMTHTEIVVQLGPSYVTLYGKGQKSKQAFMMFNVYF